MTANAWHDPAPKHAGGQQMRYKCRHLSSWEKLHRCPRSDFSATADVYAYDTETSNPLKTSQLYPGATAYDDPVSGASRASSFSIESTLLWRGTRSVPLINPKNQVRSYGIPVWDNPVRSHPISCRSTSTTTCTFRCALFGTKVLFTTRVPTSHELETCVHIHMTSATPWYPTRRRHGRSNASRRRSPLRMEAPSWNCSIQL
jgi:hypothetical protein